MLENFKGISSPHKSRFLSMCLSLFPDYGKSAQFKNNGMIVFRTGWFKPNIKIPFFTLLTYGIPRELSMVRWGTYSLKDEMYQELQGIDDAYLTDEIKISNMIDYFYVLFEETTLRNVYEYYDRSYIFGEEAETVPNDNFGIISLLSKKQVILNTLVTDFRLMAATFTLFVFLHLPGKAIVLKEIVPNIIQGEWKSIWI